MNVIDSYEKAVQPRVKTPDDIDEEMHNPKDANFAQFTYTMPTGIILGVGKSKHNHPAMFQIKIVDYAGKAASTVDSDYSGEYTSADRAEKDLLKYCKLAWQKAEKEMTKQVRATQKQKADATSKSD